MENQKGIQPKNLIGFVVAWLFSAGLLVALLTTDKEDIYTPWMYWVAFVILAFGVIFIPLKIIQKYRDYNAGRRR